MSNIVVSPHNLSTMAGIEILRQGGNAIDAAIATNIVQGVVAPETCGIGGDLFALIWINDETKPYCLDSSGYAGSNVDISSLSSYSDIPLDHPMSVTIPGAVRGWYAMHERFGNLEMKHLFNQAIEICSKGFKVSTELHQSLKSHEETLKIQDSGKELYPSGNVPDVGDTVHRNLLAKTLVNISDQGSDYFYTGQVNKAISEALNNIITPDDISSFHPQWVEPLSVEMYGKIGWVTPPHTQSYLTLATLKIYEMLENGSIAIDLHTLINSYRVTASQRDELTYV